MNIWCRPTAVRVQFLDFINVADTLATVVSVPKEERSASLMWLKLTPANSQKRLRVMSVLLWASTCASTANPINKSNDFMIYVLT